MNGIIIGKEENSWTPNGSNEVKVSRKLHVLWDKPKREQEGFEGNRVESVYCPFDFKDIPVGAYCDFEYEVRPSAKGNVARLVDIRVLSQAKVILDTGKA